MQTGVVVPAYRPDLQRLETYVRALADRVALVRVEIDAPRPEAERLLAELPCEVGTATGRRGKGAAITEGFEAVLDRVDVLAFADADGSTPADSVLEVVRAVSEGDVDLAAGSRRHPRSDVRTHQTLARRRLGDAFAWLARRLLSTELYDYQCGAKAVSASAWRRLRGHLHESGFAWDIEVLAVAGALGLTVAEVPVTWVDRPDSTVDPLSTPLAMGRALVATRRRARRIAEGRSGASDDREPLVDRADDAPTDD